MNEKSEAKDRLTHFGYQQVSPEEKTDRVRAVFDSVADRYDVMNDLMSGGLHRLWKRFALEHTGLRPGQFALDVAAGSGDLGKGMAGQVGPDGKVVLTDINPNMLANGRSKLENAGLVRQVGYSVANAGKPPLRRSKFSLHHDRLRA